MAEKKKKKWLAADKAAEALKKPEPEPKKKGGAELMYGAKAKE